MDDVQALERLAGRAREAADVVDARRAALGRNALVWWQGEAADRYAARVEERRASLAALADELRWLADAVSAVAAAVRADRDPGGLGRAS